MKTITKTLKNFKFTKTIIKEIREVLSTTIFAENEEKAFKQLESEDRRFYSESEGKMGDIILIKEEVKCEQIK